eukprot:304663-Prorocentrum_minimum.AAC.1
MNPNRSEVVEPSSFGTRSSRAVEVARAVPFALRAHRIVTVPERGPGGGQEGARRGPGGGQEG